MNNNGLKYDDCPERFDELPDTSKEIALRWIRDNLRSRKTPLPGLTSYGLKHLLQRDIGIYLTNGQFKGAMSRSGHMPLNPYELNWRFCLSKRSPTFRPSDKPCV